MSAVPSLASIVIGSSAIQDIIGSDPIRFYPFGGAPQKPTRPYVTQRAISAVPENTLSETPAIDGCRVQLSCWADTWGEAVELATLLRDAIEPLHHITDLRDSGRDYETQSFRVDLDVTVWNPREEASGS